MHFRHVCDAHLQGEERSVLRDSWLGHCASCTPSRRAPTDWMFDTKKIVERYTSLSQSRPWQMLALFMVPTLLAMFFGRPGIKTEFQELLPENAPSVRALDEAKARSARAEKFAIAVESPDPLATARFMDAIAERLNEWEEVQHVEVQRDRSFFRDHALLYLPVSDLHTIRQNLQRLVRERLAQQNPLFVDLSAEDDDDGKWRYPSTWIDPLTLQELGLERADLESMFAFADDDEPTAASLDPTEQARRNLPEEYRDYFIAPHGRVAVILARLRGSSTDTKYANGAFDYGTRLIADVDPGSFHPAMRAEVVGPFRDFIEVRSIIADVFRATLISLGLVLLLLVLFFRNLRSILIVILPLLMGVSWTLATIKLLFGDLNTLTAFIFSMLIGMGIDFGIHLYRRAQDEFHAGAAWDRALYLSLTRTGRALTTATVTTCVSLLMMTFARFTGFVEFGVACAIGVSFCFLATVLVAPVLVGVTETIRPITRRPRRAPPMQPKSVRSTTFMRAAAIMVLLLAGYGLLSARDTRWEYDFRNLRGPGTGRTIEYGDALGSRRTSAPVVILGSSQDQMREVHRELRRRLHAGDDRLRSFTTIETFVPSGQEERMEVIDDIYEVLDRRAVRNISGSDGRMITELLRLCETEPFGDDAIPEWARIELTEADGSFGKLGLFSANVSWWDILDVRSFQKRYREIDIGDEEVPLATPSFILDDVVRYVQADGNRLVFLILGGLLFVLMIDLRDLRGTIACVGTMACALLLTIAAMSWFNIKLGLYNMVVLPTVVGTGVDGAIHIYHRYLEEGRDRLWYVLRTTGVAVLASSVTTAAGFAGLVLTRHKGVESIGFLALVGVFSSVIAVLGMLPGILSFVGRQEPDNPFLTGAYGSIEDLKGDSTEP